ncbi:Hypothetical protein FKW44_015303, partial [Caligus rogercresseyi]
QPEDMDRANEEELTEIFGQHEEGGPSDGKQEEEWSLDIQDKSIADSDKSKTDACDLITPAVDEPGYLKNQGMRDDWVRVMHRGSSIPMKKNNSDHELKKNKRSFNSPETDCKKRTRDCVSKALEA